LGPAFRVQKDFQKEKLSAANYGMIKRLRSATEMINDKRNDAPPAVGSGAAEVYTPASDDADVERANERCME